MSTTRARNVPASQPDLFGALPTLLLNRHVDDYLRPDGRRRAARARRRRDRERDGAVRDGVHPHSMDVHVDRADDMNRRKAMILRWLRRYGPATDRAVKDSLFGQVADMNMVRPRITDLIDSGDVVEAGKTVCSVTGVRVRLVRARFV